MPWSAPETFLSTVFEEVIQDLWLVHLIFSILLLDIYVMLKVFMAISRTTCLVDCPNRAPPFSCYNSNQFL